MRIAVVGTGISGLLSARLLATRHEVTTFEADARPGGHTNTLDVRVDGRRLAVDTGFIVYNETNYPGFVRLLSQLDVATQPSDMSFSVRDERTGLEWRGSSLSSLFAQRRNLLRPRFWRLVREILRFFREAPRVLESDAGALPLGEWLAAEGYSEAFLDHFLLPMGAAIWSSDPQGIRVFPAAAFVRFFENHGMLRLRDRPIWRTVTGGARTYVQRMVDTGVGRLRLSCPVRGVERLGPGVRLELDGGREESFDAVVLACHSDTALRLLRDPSQAEREVLAALPYRSNEAALHTDERLMPRSRRAWASWNWQIPTEVRDVPTVTYYMNRLQSLPGPTQLFVTLNRTDEIEPARILSRIRYHHPVFTPQGFAAQRRRPELNGVRDTWFCGAYWGYGFHEDGAQSALAVARDFGVEP